GRDLEYFEQLTAEKKYTRYHNGFAKHEWKKDSGARNEALDCRVYAYAALQSLFASGLRLSVHCDRFEKMLGRKPSRTPQLNPEPMQVAAEPEPTAQIDPFRAPEDPEQRNANPFTHHGEGGFIPRRNWFGK
ncbi:MAG: phage terminase large subunit family protein, partial [Terracidiphilus sp.]|nr:phage terminase large subunit family protein [Terracidiphilus sp.]